MTVGPAYAGMIRWQAGQIETDDGWPRIRGDDPVAGVNSDWGDSLAPHTRG